MKLMTGLYIVQSQLNVTQAPRSINQQQLSGSPKRGKFKCFNYGAKFEYFGAKFKINRNHLKS